MRQSGGRIGATLAALAAAVLLSPPVQADEYVEVDPAGDMVREVRGRVVPAPENPSFDLRRVVVRHETDRVIIRASMVDLDLQPIPRGRTYFGLVGFVLVDSEAMPPEGRAWRWEALWRKSRPHDPSRLLVNDAESQEVDRCFADSNRNDTGLRGRIDYRRDLIVVSIPRLCFGYDDVTVPPRWVRVSVSSQAAPYFDHLIKPTARTWAESRFAYYTPRLYPSNGVVTRVDAGLSLPERAGAGESGPPGGTVSADEDPSKRGVFWPLGAGIAAAGAVGLLAVATRRHLRA